MLSLFKKPVLILLLIVALAGGGYYFAKKQGFILGQSASDLQNLFENNYPQLNNLVQKLPFTGQLSSPEVSQSSSTNDSNANNFLQDSLQQTGQQLGTLSENGQAVKDQLLKFASEIKESTQSTPLHEKAFEYGQYLYCQQVVKEYENNPQ